MLTIQRLTPWPDAPYCVNFPGSAENALVFIELNESGKDIQSTALISLLIALIRRLHVPYPNPNFDVVTLVPELPPAGLNAFILDIQYKLPSQEESALQATINVLKILCSQIAEHGIKDLRAEIDIGLLDNVGDVSVVTKGTPLLPIPHNTRPIFVTIAAQVPVIEVTKIGAEWDEPTLTAVFEATQKAFDEIFARPHEEYFDSVGEYARISGGPNVASVGMLRVQPGGDEALTNTVLEIDCHFSDYQAKCSKR